jgi:cation transport regulator ChaB
MEIRKHLWSLLQKLYDSLLKTAKEPINNNKDDYHPETTAA